MLTVKGAADHATVSEALIRVWLADGTLPHFKFGASGRRGHIRILLEDLEATLAAFKVGKRKVETRPAPTGFVPKHVRLKPR